MSLASRVRPWLEGAAALLAALIPLGFALSLAAASPQWRDDMAVVRGLGLAVAPGAGAASTLLLLALRLVPVGNMAFRAALVAALGLAAVGFLLFSLTRRLLDLARPSALNPLLALLAALTAALSSSLLREASVGGGSTVALAIALGALQLWTPASASSLRTWPWLGAALGLALAENAILAVALGAALLVQGLLLRPRAGERALGLGASGFAAVAALVALPALLRPLAPTSWVGLGLAHGFGELRALDVVSLRGRGLGAWLTDVGVVAFVCTWAGAARGLLRPGARWAIAPLMVPLALDVLAPASSSGVLSPDPLGPLRALALCTAAAAAALGVQGLALFLIGSALPLARPAGVLVVAGYATLAVVAAEEGSTLADRGHNAGAEAWTDQALERLPPSSLVLARTDATLWRLWAARLGSGMRPDVTVVPVPLLGKGKLAGALLQEEPALTALLRDISASGSFSEFGLSTLADARPLFTELDPHADRRIAAHLADEHLWLRFVPQSYGNSDRHSGQAAATTAFYRVVAAARREEPHDEATLEVLAAHGRELAAACALAHDREGVQQALLHLSALHRDPAPDDELWLILDPGRKPDPRSKRARR